VLGGIVAFAYFIVRIGSGIRDLQGAVIGLTIFSTVVFAQLSLLLFLAPVFSSGAITIEREQRTLPALLTTLLTPFQIWWGKFISSILFVLLLIFVALPVLALSFAFGGVGPREVFMATLSTLIALTTVSLIGLFWSSVFRRSVHATAVSYATVIALTVVTTILFSTAMFRATGARDHIATWRKLALYFNPYALVVFGLAPVDALYPEWVRSVCCFAGMSLLAAYLTVRNLRNADDNS
jgi:ABC-type transport system involved in multi-copper enzyme maturation permease subunit